MKKLLLTAAALIISINANAMVTTLSDVTLNPTDLEVDINDERFLLTDLDGVNDDATIFLLSENSPKENFNSLWIYDPVNGNALSLFSGVDTAISSVTLSWDINTSTVTNNATLASAVINPLNFGFFLKTFDNLELSTISSDNLGSVDFALVFDTTMNGRPGLFGADAVIAFDDGFVGDNLFNDMVIGVSDISQLPTDVVRTPVPSPMTLFGSGLVGLAGMTELRNRKRKIIKRE